MIVCVFYAEFHNKEGSKLLFQHPDNFIPPDLFETYSEYFITKPQLSDKLITFAANHTLQPEKKLLFMGIPQCIEGKYERNALMFNVVFVFDISEDTAISEQNGGVLNGSIQVATNKQQSLQQQNAMYEIEVYKPVLRKFIYYLKTLEIETQFLYNPNLKNVLKDILPQVMNDLNSKKESVIPIDGAHIIHLRAFPTFHEPSEVKHFDVPVPIRDFKKLGTEKWDLTVQQILPYIDGTLFVKQIALKASVHIELVRKALKHLLYYDCIKMIDIFQYSNMYAVKSKFHILQLFKNKQFQNDCMQACDANALNEDGYDMNGSSESMQSFSIRDVVALYCKLKAGTRLKDIFDPSIPLLNHRGFVAFGLLRGIIARVHEYPVLEVPPSISIESVIEQNAAILMQQPSLPYSPSSNSLASLSRVTSLQQLSSVGSTDDIASIGSTPTGASNYLQQQLLNQFQTKRHSPIYHSPIGTSNQQNAPTVTGTSGSSTNNKQNSGAETNAMSQHAAHIRWMVAQVKLMMPMLNGNHCFDELCCEWEMSRRQLLACLSLLGNYCHTVFL